MGYTMKQKVDHSSMQINYSVGKASLEDELHVIDEVNVVSKLHVVDKVNVVSDLQDFADLNDFKDQYAGENDQ